jgi:hypothetical protein
MYVLGTEIPMKFFNGGRALTSVLSRYPKSLEYILDKYEPSVTRVRDYYKIRKHEVVIQDISAIVGW